MVRPAAPSASTISVRRRSDDLASLAQIDLHRPTRALPATNDAVDRAEEPTSALREVEALVAAGAR